MRFLTADYLYPLHIDPIKEGVLEINDNGEIVTIFKKREDVIDKNIEVFEGVLCPGFINSHCHLELSHLRNFIKETESFLDFISAIAERNKFSHEDIQNAIQHAEDEMIKNGIVGVGDICNTEHTIYQKQKNNLEYYNFIEVFGVQEISIEKNFLSSLKIRNKFRSLGQQATLTPHAAYSVPPIMMQKIAKIFDQEDKLYSIHMQETIAEGQLFIEKSGMFFDWLQKIGAVPEIWEKRHNSTDFLEETEQRKLLLVHNTFSVKQEIKDHYYCTCPRSNLYLGNTLPDYSIFNTNKLCVGTDSLASNKSLSILEELKIIAQNSNFDLNILLKIASKNGAEALEFNKLGTFEKGKNPGVILLQNLDNMKITNNSTITRLK